MDRFRSRPIKYVLTTNFEVVDVSSLMIDENSGQAKVTSTATSGPSITVMSPNGGESWVRGSTHAIDWTSSGNIGSYVKIELLKSGAVVQTITSSTLDDGSYSIWTISSGLATGTDYRIRVTSLSNSAITDTSNNNFAISGSTSSTSAASITVTSPNGGESWVRGSTHAIDWTSSGNIGSYVKIELLKSGAVVQTITSSTS